MEILCGGIYTLLTLLLFLLFLLFLLLHRDCCPSILIIQVSQEIVRFQFNLASNLLKLILLFPLSSLLFSSFSPPLSLLSCFSSFLEATKTWIIESKSRWSIPARRRIIFPTICCTTMAITTMLQQSIRRESITGLRERPLVVDPVTLSSRLVRERRMLQRGNSTILMDGLISIKIDGEINLFLSNSPLVCLNSIS